jgi:hypothetical protein
MFSGVDGYGCFRQIEFLSYDAITSAPPGQLKLWMMGGIDRARSSRTSMSLTNLEMRVTPNYDPNGIILHVQTANELWMWGGGVIKYRTTVGDIDVRTQPVGQTVADYLDDYNEWRKDELAATYPTPIPNDHKRRFRL